MPRDNYNAEYERNRLLDQLKIRYSSGQMRHVLCEMHSPDITADSPATLRYKWMSSSGLGGSAFDPSEKHEAKAAQELLERGLIVPAFLSQCYTEAYRPLRLIEDLQWGFRKDSSVVIFDLADLPNIPDGIITPDARYDAAINQVKKRIDDKEAGFDRPVGLSDGTEVTPVTFGRDRLVLRARQNLYYPR